MLIAREPGFLKSITSLLERKVESMLMALEITHLIRSMNQSAILYEQSAVMSRMA